MGQQLHRRLPPELVEAVLEAFNEHRIAEQRACELLGLRRTQLYTLRARWLRDQLKGHPFVVWNRPTSAFHQWPAEVQDWLHEQLRYIRDDAELFRGRFNFAFLAEEAEKQFGQPFHRNSLRRWALRQGYYHATPDEKRKVYTRFETAGPGALFQHDSSPHVWLPLTQRQQSLILTQDDYSRRVVGARLVERESAWHHLQVARVTVEEVGRPLAYYVDNHSIFRYVGYTGRHYRYRKGPDEGEQQFKRALQTLDIGLIYASSPEAKGKIEKRFDYFQRRLPFLCEKYRITDLAEANRLLRELMAFYNEQRVHQETGEIPQHRWEAAFRHGKSCLRPLEPHQDLEVIFALQDERLVKKDGTISFLSRLWKVGQLPGQKVTVALIPPTKLIILKGSEKLWEYHLEPPVRR